MSDRRMAVLLLLVVCAAVALFLKSFERYDESIDHGATARATRNPYLAAEIFLRRRDQRFVESHASWASLDELPAGGTLFIVDSQLILSDGQVDRLIEWVRSGGSLVVGAASHPEGDGPDRLLARFGVGNRPVIDTEDEDPRPVSRRMREWNDDLDAGVDRKKTHAPVVSPGEITHLDFEGRGETLELHFSERHVLHHVSLDESDADEAVDSADGDGLEPASVDETPTPDRWADSEAGHHVFQFELGEGRLTILSDASIWRSSRIGDFDHADLLRKLSNEEGRILILYGRQMMGAIEWLRGNAAQPLVGLMLCFGAWLWSRGRRFGPLREDLPIARRSLSEQLVAHADYLWHHGHHAILVEAMREQIDRRARGAPRSGARDSESMRLARRSGSAGLGEDALREAIIGEAPRTEREFLDLARYLQRIRNAS